MERDTKWVLDGVGNERGGVDPPRRLIVAINGAADQLTARAPDQARQGYVAAVRPRSIARRMSPC